MTATAEYQLGKYEIARADLNRLVAVDASAGAPWALLGLCNFELGEYAAAADQLRRGMQLGVPNQFDMGNTARFRRASSETMLGNYETAVWILLSIAARGVDDAERKELAGAVGLAALRMPLLETNTVRQRA